MAPLQYFHTRVEFWVGCFFFFDERQAPRRNDRDRSPFYQKKSCACATFFLFDVFVNEINELALRQGLPDNTVFNVTALCALLLGYPDYRVE